MADKLVDYSGMCHYEECAERCIKCIKFDRFAGGCMAEHEIDIKLEVGSNVKDL
jgi:hypothetical protein